MTHLLYSFEFTDEYSFIINTMLNINLDTVLEKLFNNENKDISNKAERFIKLFERNKCYNMYNYL